MVTFLSGDCPQIDVRVTRIPLADIPLHSEEVRPVVSTHAVV
jgi:hypothetical protein